MEEKQQNVKEEPANGQQCTGNAPSSGTTSYQSGIAVIFGLLQVAWLGWLAFVAWKVLSS